MNGELQLPDMLHCVNASRKLNVSGSDMSLLERQRERMRWQQDQNFQRGEGYIGCSAGLNGGSFSMQAQVGQMQNFQDFMVGGDSVLAEAVNHAVKADPGLGNEWTQMGNFDMPCMGFGSSASLASCVAASDFDTNSAITRTLSCPPAVVKAVTEAKSRELSLSEKICCPTGRESFKKRKAGSKVQNPKTVEADDKKDKKIKVCAEEGESKITSSKNNTVTNNNKKSSNENSDRETSDASKENSKVSEVQKPDYIHVRARRGQATDSHSLAERVRREKISERMKYLQDLVPGCNKITGKAGMLDEIINYVQSLQRQVEFLSMKLAAVNPRLDFNIDDLFAKEVFPACQPGFPAMGMSDMTNPAYLKINQAQQMAAYCGIEMAMNPSDMSLRRTISAPVSMPETFIDSSSCYTQMQPSWEADLPAFYSSAFDQGRLQSFPSQPLTGSMEACNLKRVM